jgi:cytochrome c-type biogenesis protein CcmH
VRDRLLTQLNEVDLEARDKNMDAATASDERARLEAELAAVLKQIVVVAPGPAPIKQDQGRSKKLWRAAVAVLVLAVPSVAAGLYWINVTVPPAQLQQAAATAAPGGMPDPLQMVARLEARLQQNPDDVAGWLRLGRSYAVLGRLDDAVAAYDHAYRQLPKDYQADSPEALWFLGLAAYKRGDQKRALDLWQSLLATLPPDSDAAQQLKHVMQQARAKGAKK